MGITGEKVFTHLKCGILAGKCDPAKCWPSGVKPHRFAPCAVLLQSIVLLQTLHMATLTVNLRH
ncbi:hypothetical protein E2C01_064814 [Portunus trituberculatus]|uniref:Uncharacterized protein n=1 Tax=Portunus trituberculatus TaxID=210409 RepID=A0A5B7HH63_PORTR|nr:hypothetical protein [Portunus trituberculatus]